MAQEQLLNWEVINGEVAKAIKGTKIVANESKTGVSYFQGKKRLLKVLKTKRNIKVEINVALPKDMEGIVGMDKITVAMAHKKHLGTMKYLFTGMDVKGTLPIIKEAVSQFKKDLEQEQKAQ